MSNEPIHGSYNLEMRNLVRMRRRGIYVYALPNIFTTANLLFGFLSISLAIDGNYNHAAWAIVLASIFDLLDGRVARLTKTTTNFGVEYDSLCDLVSFGLAPAFLTYMSALKTQGRIGLVVAMIYTVCGALRLARFNVLSTVLPKSYFQGLPIPIASLAIATMYFFANEYQYSLQNSSLVLCFVLVLGLLMISTIRFPSFKDFHPRRKRSMAALALFLAVAVLLLTWFETTAFLGITGYILFALLFDLVRWKRRKKPRF